LNSDGQQYNQYKQNKQPPLTNFSAIGTQMTKQVNYIDEDYGINFKVFHSEIKLPLVDRYAY
jgi:hypothetical protein